MNCEKIPSIISNMEWVNNRGETGIDGKVFLSIFLSWLVLAIPASVVYLGLYFLLIWIQQRDSILLTGVMWNIPYCIFAGFLTAIAISYFTRLWFVRLLYRKNYEKLAEQDQINSSRGADKVMRFFTRLVIVGSIVFTVFIATWNLNFKSDGFVDNTGFFSIRGEYHDYDEVESVSYIPNRVNGYGETLERPSYKLVLKNGKEIDLYEYAEISDYDPDLIDFLKSKGVKVVHGEKED